jgi:excisionase family DNA binding protein
VKRWPNNEARCLPFIPKRENNTPPNRDAKAWFTMKEVGQRLSLAEETIRKQIHDGKIKAQKFGRAVRFPKPKFCAWRLKAGNKARRCGCRRKKQAQETSTSIEGENIVKISERALIPLIQHINRRLAPDYEQLRRSPNESVERVFGRYYVVNFKHNFIVNCDVDIDALGRDLGVIRELELSLRASEE